jgi:hypothetical protein
MKANRIITQLLLTLVWYSGTGVNVRVEDAAIGSWMIPVGGVTCHRQERIQCAAVSSRAAESGVVLDDYFRSWKGKGTFECCSYNQ